MTPHRGDQVEHSPPRYLTVAWVLLLAYGLFPLFAVATDLSADFSIGIPADHQRTFAQLSGSSWEGAKRTAAGATHYITLLEKGYAIHELVFALLFLAIVAVPFRRGERWAWWACWTLMIANVTYSLTFGRYDSTILRQSLYADIALPILLLASIRRFFFTPTGRSRATEVNGVKVRPRS